jgi:NAD/NADP transhydrogenase beta subunit
MRTLWDQLMIVLMAAVLFVCAQELWHSTARLSEVRCMLGMGLAIAVIVLKIQALRQNKASK